MKSAYRDDQDVLRAKVKELRRQYISELFSLSPVFFETYQKRFARIWAGAAGILGTALLVGCALYSAMEAPSELNLVSVLLFAALFPFVAYLISHLFVGHILLGRMMSFLYTSAELHLFVEQLQASSAQKNMREALERLEKWSIGLPLVALSLLAPLTIHLGFSFVFDVFTTFNSWILLSMLIVGHSHLLLACYAWAYSRELSISQTCDFFLLDGRGWRALWIVTGFSFFPGVIFSGGLVFVTGMLFVPAMFGWASWILSKERTAIEIATD